MTEGRTARDGRDGRISSSIQTAHPESLPPACLPLPLASQALCVHPLVSPTHLSVPHPRLLPIRFAHPPAASTTPSHSTLPPVRLPPVRLYHPPHPPPLPPTTARPLRLPTRLIITLRDGRPARLPYQIEIELPESCIDYERYGQTWVFAFLRISVALSGPSTSPSSLPLRRPLSRPACLSAVLFPVHLASPPSTSPSSASLSGVLSVHLASPPLGSHCCSLHTASASARRSV